MTQLVHYEAARLALDAAVQFDDVMKIMDVAEQAALYAKQANDNELIEKATEIRVRAQRKAGEMLRKSAEQGQRNTGGKPSQAATVTPTLSEIGITRSQSSRYQALAAMPDDHFETAVQEAKATAGEVTTAFMLREASRHKPAAKKVTKRDKERLQELEEARARGVSMLSTYARLTLTALRVASTLTDQERELLDELGAAIHEVSNK